MALNNKRYSLTDTGKRPEMLLAGFAGWLVMQAEPVLGAVQSVNDAAPQSLQADIIMLAVFVLVALVFSFICSVAEAVLLSITPSYIENLRSSQPARAELVKKLRQDNVDRSLAAILTVNTIAHTVGAIAAGAKATTVFGSAWIGVFSGAMTLAILFLSEIIPKTIGAVYWPKLVRATTYFILGATTLLYPLIRISEGLTRLIAHGKSVHLFSRDELLAMTNIGERTGQIKEYESRIIRNLMQFSSVRAMDIMTPRTVITTLQNDISVTDALKLILENSFSRLPVYGEGKDDILGVVLKDEILAYEAQGKGTSPLSEIRRDIEQVSADMSLPQLLEQFLADRQHIAIVVDAYGGTKGLVTLEDVIEALLGMEIMDEMDSVQDMQKLARKQWLVRAKKLGLDVELIEQISPEELPDPSRPE